MHLTKEEDTSPRRKAQRKMARGRPLLFALLFGLLGLRVGLAQLDPDGACTSTSFLYVGPGEYGPLDILLHTDPDVPKSCVANAIKGSDNLAIASFIYEFWNMGTVENDPSLSIFSAVLMQEEDSSPPVIVAD